MTIIDSLGELPRTKRHGSTLHHPGGNPGANLQSTSQRCHPILVAFVWELTRETIYLPLGCLQGGGLRVIKQKKKIWGASCHASDHRGTLAHLFITLTTLEATQRHIHFFLSTPIQMPPESGGICGRLT